MKRFYFYIPKFGILTLLYLLEIYEAAENYETCSEITAAINEFNADFETNFPTRICESVEIMVRNDFAKFGIDGQNVDMGKYYAYATYIYSNY